jgi:ATP-dependent Clp protease ATP-binding subunit ClpX
MEYCLLCNEYVNTKDRYYTSPNGYICFKCGYDLINMTSNLTLHNGYDEIDSFTQYKPKAIVEYLNKHVIGQNNVKETLAIAVYNHYKRIKKDTIYPNIKLEKSNILLAGPSGSGKTLLCKTIAKLFDVPFVIVDATTFTQAGYIGEDIESMLTKLYLEANSSISKTEKGIVFIDEIDKIASKPTIGRDASGLGVQQALLKFLEGSIVNTPTELGKRTDKNVVQINTDNILFICSGAFVNLDEITEDSLINFGLIPELIGRLPIKIKTDKLTEQNIRDILVTPENSILMQYKKLFMMDNIKLEVKPEALDEIAHICYESTLGARNIRTIFERILHDGMFNLPGSNRKTFTISKEYVQKQLKKE